MPRALTEGEVADFKSRLCAAAEDLFARDGWRGVTMRELAGELGVSPMAAYRYYPDRDSILAAARAAAFSRFADRLEAGFMRGTDAMDRSRAVGEAYLGFALAEPNAYRLIFDGTQHDESRYPDLQRQSLRARELLARQADDLIAGGFARADAHLVGYALWSASHGVCVLHLAGKYPDHEECRRAFAATMRWLFKGLASELASHPPATTSRKPQPTRTQHAR